MNQWHLGLEDSSARGGKRDSSDSLCCPMCHVSPPALKVNIKLQQEIKGNYFRTVRTSDTAQLYDTNWIISQMLRPVTVHMEITSQGSLGSSNIWNTCLQSSVGKLTNAAAQRFT